MRQNLSKALELPKKIFLTSNSSSVCLQHSWVIGNSASQEWINLPIIFFCSSLFWQMCTILPFLHFKRKHASKKVSSYHIFLAKEYLCYHAICVVRIKYWIIFPTSSTKNVTVSKSLWVIYLTFVENKLLLEISKHCLEKTDLKSSVCCLEIFSEAVFLKQWLCKYRYFLFQKILSKDH